MHRVGTWLQRGKLSASSSTQSLDALAESQNLELALRAVELILDDDIKGAEEGLAEGSSAFHKLCKGVLGFMKATLGFEQEIMKEASLQLADAETSASNSYYKAQRESRAFSSQIYEKGAEFALCQAEAQIMAAVVGVLNESLTESLKGFYKLRKAYMTLDGLMQMEHTFMKAREVGSLATSRQQSSESLDSVVSKNSTPAEQSVQTGAASRKTPETSQTALPSGLRQAHSANDGEEASEVNGVEKASKVDGGNVETSEDGHDLEKHLKDLSVAEQDGAEKDSPFGNQPSISHPYDLLTEDPDSEIFNNSLDVFIHSGTNLCYGLLSLLISSIPPSFGKLLWILGFRGDRDKGMRMLWQASKFSNINGGMAGLIILGWYNGFVGFCDILPDSDPTVREEVEGYPAKRLRSLLMEMRRRYPKSHHWLIEEARTAASRRRLDETLALLKEVPQSQMRQLEALHFFEKSLSSMNAHQYQMCSDSFIRCVDLNTWSQALYFYTAGAAHLAMYRDLKSVAGKEKEADNHAKLAEENFKTAPGRTGKKKMMGKQLPFDIFVNRKMAKWEQRAQDWRCSFVDAIGVSPLEEMTFFWNGHKKMDAANLELSLKNLAWSESNPLWEKEDLDEHAVLAVLRAVVYRNLRRHDESKASLQNEVLCHDAHLFKGANKDDWTAPAAHYEMAVNLWMERTQYIKQHGRDIVNVESPGIDIEVDLAGDTQLVKQCKQHIIKAKGWERYTLDVRIGMKVTAADEAIKKWETRNEAAGKS